MKDGQIRERIKNGWLRALVTFEIVGKPKAHIEKSLQEYIANLKKDDRLVFLRDEVEPAESVDDGLFSTFCEAELLIKNLETCTWLCLNFSPASIEIIEPDELELPARDVQNWLNDLLAQVHEVGANVRTHVQANEHLGIAMNQLIRNAILLSVRDGAKEPKHIEKDTGIDSKQLQPFLDRLVENERLVQNGTRYALRK
jgi:hypothetical protein